LVLLSFSGQAQPLPYLNSMYLVEYTYDTNGVDTNGVTYYDYQFRVHRDQTCAADGNLGEPMYLPHTFKALPVTATNGSCGGLLVEQVSPWVRTDSQAVHFCATNFTPSAYLDTSLTDSGPPSVNHLGEKRLIRETFTCVYRFRVTPACPVWRLTYYYLHYVYLYHMIPSNANGAFGASIFSMSRVEFRPDLKGDLKYLSPYTWHMALSERPATIDFRVDTTQLSDVRYRFTWSGAFDGPWNRLPRQHPINADTVFSASSTGLYAYAPTPHSVFSEASDPRQEAHMTMSQVWYAGGFAEQSHLVQVVDSFIDSVLVFDAVSPSQIIPLSPFTTDSLELGDSLSISFAIQDSSLSYTVETLYVGANRLMRTDSLDSLGRPRRVTFTYYADSVAAMDYIGLRIVTDSTHCGGLPGGISGFRVAVEDTVTIGLAPVVSREAAFALAPNPTPNRVTLTWAAASATVATVAVTDLTGRIVWQQTWDTNQPAQLETADWPAGVYTVSVRHANGQGTKRLLVR